MTAQEHLAIALQFREIAHELLRRNQSIAAGEMFWGAANRIILAINLQHAIIPADQPLRRNTVVRHLDAKYRNLPTFQQGLSAAGRLHGYFYNSNLPSERLAAFIRDAETFIAALFNLPETAAISSA